MDITKLHWKKSKKSKSDFILVLVRHAHRNKSGARDSDNGLSAKGKKQAKALLQFYKKSLKAKDVFFLSSPKKRCYETLQPLSHTYKSDLFLIDGLDEGAKSREDLSEIILWINEASKKARVVFLCAHGDVIPWLTQHLCATELNLKKGAALEMRESAGDAPFRVSQLLQAFPASPFDQANDS